MSTLQNQVENLEEKGSCPKCGELNSYESMTCSMCGEVLPWGRAIAKARSVHVESNANKILSVADAQYLDNVFETPPVETKVVANANAPLSVARASAQTQPIAPPVSGPHQQIGSNWPPCPNCKTRIHPVSDTCWNCSTRMPKTQKVDPIGALFGVILLGVGLIILAIGVIAILCVLAGPFVSKGH